MKTRYPFTVCLFAQSHVSRPNQDDESAATADARPANVLYLQYYYTYRHESVRFDVRYRQYIYLAFEVASVSVNLSVNKTVQMGTETHKSLRFSLLLSYCVA